MKKMILAAILIAQTTIAVSQYNLSGFVSASGSDERLAGAHVRLDGTMKQAVTDRMGNFSFGNLKDGSYSLITSYIGYKTDTVSIALRGTLNLPVRLIESPILADEIVIQSTRAGGKMPMSYQDIDKKGIHSSNFGQDLPVLISGSISAVATSDAGNGVGYTALRIRGTDLTRINVTVDGIPLNDPESHNVFWVDLPDIAASTENIQIQRGVGTSTNGASAFGASINLQLSQLRNEPFGEASVAYGSFNTQRYAGSFGTGLLNKHWSMEGRISRLYSDGYVDRAESSLLSYHLSTSWSDSKNIFRFNILSGREKTYQAWDGIPGSVLDTNRRYNGIGAYYNMSGNLKYYDNETDNYTQDHYQFHYSREISKRLYLSASAHYTRGKGFYEQYKDDEDLADYGIVSPISYGQYIITNEDTTLVPGSLNTVTDLIRRKWLDNDFGGITYGLNWNHNRLRSTLGGSWNVYSGRHFGRIIWTESGNGLSPDFEWYRSKSQKKDFNIYSKWNLELSRQLSLYADLQLRNINYSINGIDDDLRDISQDHHFLFFNPKLGMYASLSPTEEMYVSLAVASREPNRDNFVDADPGKPKPQAETLYNLEISHQHRQGWLSVSENLYLMYYRDQLALTGAINDVGAPVMENIPESYRIGLEVTSEIRPVHYLKWNLTFTLSRNKITRFTEYVDNWDTWGQETIEHKNTDLAFAPAFTGNSEISWTLSKSASIYFHTRMIGRQYIDNTQKTDRSLDPYLLNDLRFSWLLKPSFCKEFSLSLSLNNLFNHQYESNAWVYRYVEEGKFRKLDGYFPQAGFNFMAGLNVKF